MSTQNTTQPIPRKKLPLEVKLFKGVLSISVGVHTLASAFNVQRGFKVTNAHGFAEDVMFELNMVNPPNGSLVQQMLEDAMYKAWLRGTDNAIDPDEEVSRSIALTENA